MGYQCEKCGREFGNGGALATHSKTHWGPNRRAIEATLQELEQAGVITRREAANVQAARSQAEQLDQTKKPNAQMWRTYRETVADLLRMDDGSDSFEKLMQEINSRAPVGHKTQT